MAKVARVDTLKCTGCGACTFECPVGALEVIDMKCQVKEGCTGCGACTEVCNWKAITLEDEKDESGGIKEG
jgi:ferredoxin